MNLENDEDDIPNEQQVYASFQSNNEISKLHSLANLLIYDNNHLVYLSKYFQDFEYKNINNYIISVVAICLRKFTEQYHNQNPHLITKILAKFKQQLQQIQILNDIHIAFLQSCIKSCNYKIGYQFIKSKIFLQGTLEKKTFIIREYFYLSGLIANAQRDFEEAFRCYKIAQKLSPSDLSLDQAQKMEALLCFRLGLELKNCSRYVNSIIVEKLQSILDDKDCKVKNERESGFSDQDLIICVNEWSEQAKLYQFLKNEQELHSKVNFDQINNHVKIQNQETLIDRLLEINKIHNMFLINEEKRYIEFRYNNLSYKDINEQLESRLELLKQLLHSK